MRPAMRLTAIVLACLSLAAAGCGKKSQAQKAGAPTPRLAVIGFYKAVEDGNRESFMASTYAPAELAELKEAAFQAMVAVSAFVRDMERAYGRNAGLIGQRLPGALPPISEIESGIEIKQEGDKAIAAVPRNITPIKLIKVNGRWVVDISEDMPRSPEDRHRALKSANDVLEAIRVIHPKIAQSGYTAEALYKELVDAVETLQAASGPATQLPAATQGAGR